MSELKMPAKGAGAAAMLQELNAEHSGATGDGVVSAEQNFATPEASNVVSNVTTLQRTPEASNVVTSDPSHDTTNEAANARSNVASSKKARTAPPEQQDGLDGSARSKPSEREARLTKALKLADDDITVVTIRVSGQLNKYMDRYVERINKVQPKGKYRKQDAIAEAFAAFYADHPMPPAPAEEDEI